MARRGREAALKRAREKARQEKQEAKRERQQSRAIDEPDVDPVDEQALMEEFARLSERHESDQISTEHFNEERTRIFSQLGIEPAD
jgi:hypothetical protein